MTLFYATPLGLSPPHCPSQGSRYAATEGLHYVAPFGGKDQDINIRTFIKYRESIAVTNYPQVRISRMGLIFHPNLQIIGNFESRYFTV
uniref:Uncharacterized protein n=1 Tax=Candidatus Kentrum sp. DK TaxID=2126562 RepID=A0A450TIY6_9GAMM|nr:MAG: hypothetical protein BECKDK2373C_GA0170839_11626 [Candidatus Kentron sp. DK]